jgi:hypothetical protein
LRHSTAAGMHRYGELSIVPTNSKLPMYSDSMSSPNAPLGSIVLGTESRFLKPQDVGSVDRMKCWLRTGTYRMAQPRGTCSHLLQR